MKVLKRYHRETDVNAIDNNLGLAPIHSIVRRKRKNRLQLLLALLVHSNVDVNLAACDGNTPLHMIVRVSSLVNSLMTELIFLGPSFYLRMTYRISSPVGFSDSKMYTATGPGIASIFAVICESNHAHFVTRFRLDKVDALWHKKQP